ncbi:MAG: PIN domain-containing protein [bacterium]
MIPAPIPTNDIWIAATALELGASLITYDAHFATIPGLIVDVP